MTSTVDIKKNQEYAVKSTGVASIKDVDSVGRTVSGFFNTYNFYDSDMDVLLLGSAKKTIKERGPASKAVAKIKHALNHDLTTLPGKIKVLEEREIGGVSGIYFETKMADTTLGNDTLKNYLEGIYDNHSIGFRYGQVEMIERDAKDWNKYFDMIINQKDVGDIMFIVKEIELYEGSTVAFGANKLTPYLGVKSGNKDSLRIALNDRINKISRTLKNGTQSDDMMSVLEVQMFQLKQMINELTELVPIPRVIEKKTDAKEMKDESASKGIDLTYVANNFKL